MASVGFLLLICLRQCRWTAIEPGNSKDEGAQHSIRPGSVSKEARHSSVVAEGLTLAGLATLLSLAGDANRVGSLAAGAPDRASKAK